MSDAAALSKAEYLKRYLSGGGGDAGSSTKKKKKSKKWKPVGSGITIVEEDAFMSINSGAKPDMDSDMEEEIQIEAEIKRKVDSTKAKFRNAFSAVEEPVIKKEPLSRSPSPDPPRRQRIDSGSPPPRRQRRDSDNSPPRAGQRRSSPPVARKRRDSDTSPPRRQRRDSDNSPPRAGQRRSSPVATRKRRDSDASPPRRKRRDSDNSPPRAGQRRSSPPMARKRRDSDASPPRRQRRDSDNSPPRAEKGRKRRDSDASPPRRGRRDSDASPPRKRKTSDSSPPRRREADSSPPRRKRMATPEINRAASSPKRIKEEPIDENDGPMTRTLDGKKAGLQSAADLREEGIMMKNREVEMFTKLAAEISGRGAETITRQKMVGRGRDKPEDKEKKEREAAKQAELEDKYKSWNKGLHQQKERAEKLEEAVRVAAEPWARAKDDEAMNDHLKDLINEKEDPMAKMILQKRQKIDIQKGRYVYPRYEGAWPPNRFGIPPGYRWDGVIRGNGFEGQLSLSANQKRASEQEFYQNIQCYE